MAIPSKFGTDYSRYFIPVPGEVVPFPNPANDGQRIMNARVRAERAGDPIGSGELRIDGTLVDPDRGFGRAVLSKPQIMIPAVLGGGLALGSLLPAATTAAAGGGGAAGVIPGTGIPTVAGTGVGVTAPAFGASAATTAATSAAAAGGSSVIEKIIKAATSPGGIATLATLLPSLMNGGGSNPFGGVDVENELSQTLALQRGRMEQAQPVYDTLVNMAYGMSPTRSRGEAPAGYTPNPAPSGAYQYQGPRFGGG